MRRGRENEESRWATPAIALVGNKREGKERNKEKNIKEEGGVEQKRKKGERRMLSAIIGSPPKMYSETLRASVHILRFRGQLLSSFHFLGKGQ